MSRISCQFVAVLCTLCLGIAAVRIHPEQMIVSQGEGFQLILSPSENSSSSSSHLKDCRLTFKAHDLFLNETAQLPTGEIIQPMAENVDHLECGVRVFNVSFGSAGFWTLSATNDEAVTEKAESFISISRVLDSGCAKDSDQCDKSEEGVVHSRQCGEQECAFWTNGKMDKDTVRISEDHSLTTETRSPLTLKSGSTILECNSDPISDCFVEHIPSGRKYLIQEGLLHQRYSAHKSDFKRGVCQFEIPNKVTDDEVGLWRMTLSNDPRKMHLCNIYLTNNATEERLRLRTGSVVKVKTTKDLVTIDCVKNLHYPLRLCYLVRFDMEFSETISNGNCAFEVSPGNWTCGFNGPTEKDADLQQRFEVIKYNEEVIDAAAKVANGSTTIECHHYNQEPISLCMIGAPSGKIYRPPTDSFQSTEFSFYSGGRMATGDCGIALPGMHAESGTWQCIIGDRNGVVLPPIYLTVASNELKEEQSH